MRIFKHFSKFTILVFLLGLFTSSQAIGQSQNVTVENSGNGWNLLVDGKPMMVNGMNWDYFPRGTNYSYSLWNQSPEFIKAALDYEMGLLQNMGVNAIRVYTGIQPEWITYIYENYGIYTMLNHSFGRYGLTVDGVWKQNTDYSDPKVRELLFSEVTQMVEDYKDVDGVLLFLLGNENNYGLFWEGAETEDIPIEDRASTAKAREMYKTFNDGILRMKQIATNRPIAICNGDLQFLDLVNELTPDADIFGTNTYRGVSFTDLFDRVRDEYGKPVLLTEFGSDAYNAQALVEDQGAQAFYQKGNWLDIYQNAPGLGGADNSLGGFTFQFSDGWWKYGQTRNLDEHDVNASWPNGGYTFDFKEGSNNMNEEWFGITAKGPTTVQGTYELFPRAAYYVLKDVHQFDPIAPNATRKSLLKYFEGISLQAAILAARGDKAALQSPEGAKMRLSRFTADIRTYNTGSELSTKPDTPFPQSMIIDYVRVYQETN